MKPSFFKKRDKQESIYLRLLKNALKKDIRLDSIDKVYFLGEVEYNLELKLRLETLSELGELLKLMTDFGVNANRDTLAIFIVFYNNQCEAFFVLNPIELYEPESLLYTLGFEQVGDGSFGELIYERT